MTGIPELHPNIAVLIEHALVDRSSIIDETKANTKSVQQLAALKIEKDGFFLKSARIYLWEVNTAAIDLSWVRPTLFECICPACRAWKILKD